MVHISSSHESYKAEYKYIRDTCQQDRPKGVTANVIPEVATNVVPEVVAANVIPEVALNTHQAACPVKTDVIFVSGITRVLLTNQSPIMHSIIQDALENIWVFLLFNNAFLNAITIPSVTRNAMVAAAETCQSSSRIYQRLLNDEDYMTIMNCLVSHYDYTVGQKTVPMFGYLAKIEVEQIKKIR